MSRRALVAVPLLSLMVATACTGGPKSGLPTRQETNVTVTGVRPLAGATLTGIVRAPAGIVSNNGAGLIGDKGAGLISNNGAGFVSKTKYRALALADQPLADTTVYLADASGRPDSRFASVRTDGTGRFTFKNLPSGLTLLVVAQAKNGAEQAVALRGLVLTGAAPATFRVDVATTLVTTAALSGRTGALGRLDSASYERAVAAVASAIDAEAVDALPSDQAMLVAVDKLVAADPAVEQAIAAVRRDADAGQAQPVTSASPNSTPTPPPPSNPGANASPSAGPIASPSPTPTPPAPGVSVLAGSGAPGYAEGTGKAAAFKEMHRLDVDSAGNLYVADRYNHRIRKITPAGVVSTVAGDGTPGLVDGPAATARLNEPMDVAVGEGGVLYVADTKNQAIRKIEKGVVTTLAGNGERGFADATGAAARFREPLGLDFAQGVLYVADVYNQRIRRIDVATGAVTTYAGDGTGGFANGARLTSRFNLPIDVAVTPAGVLYVADQDNHCIRRIDATSTGTLAGSMVAGQADGTGAAARFNQPHGIALDANGRLYVADTLGLSLRQVTAAGVVTTVMGTGAPGGPMFEAKLNQPLGVAVDDRMTLYVTDTHNHCVLKVTR